MESDPPPPPAKPLLDQLEERFLKLRARDKTIKKLQREIDLQRSRMRTAYQLAKIARIAQQHHEKWIRENAADQIRTELGIKTIDGFKSRREDARAFRMKNNEQMKLATRAAKEILAGNPPPPTP